MIKSVTVTNYRNESLTLELSNPFDIGINVRSIEGIGPPKGNVNYTEIASGDGGVYNSARAGTRNITMELGLMQTPSVEENRHKVYKYFVLNKEVTLTFETDKRICQIVGYVEECEPDIFSDDETVSISVLCPNPYFYSIDAGLGLVDFSSVVNEFEFPFSVNKTEEISKELPVGFPTLFWVQGNHFVQECAESGVQAFNKDWLIKDKSWYIDTDHIIKLKDDPGTYACIQVFHVDRNIISGGQVLVNSDTALNMDYIAVTEDGYNSFSFPGSQTQAIMTNQGMVSSQFVYFTYYLINFKTDLNSIENNNVMVCALNISGSTWPPYGPYCITNYVNDRFMFPMDQSSKNLEFGSLQYRQEENVPYDGDIPAGFTIRLHAIGEVRNITIYNMDTRERLAINTERVKEITGTAFNAGDDIIISTERGNKSIIYVHDGISYNILNALERNTDWFILSKGDNVFAYICEYGTEDLLFTIEFPTLYWGI